MTSIDRVQPIKVCEKHCYEFKGNKKCVSLRIGPSGSQMTVAIRAVYSCTGCGKVIKRTPNPNYPMPKV